MFNIYVCIYVCIITTIYINIYRIVTKNYGDERTARLPVDKLGQNEGFGRITSDNRVHSGWSQRNAGFTWRRDFDCHFHRECPGLRRTSGRCRSCRLAATADRSDDCWIVPVESGYLEHHAGPDARFPRQPKSNI